MSPEWTVGRLPPRAGLVEARYWESLQRCLRPSLEKPLHLLNLGCACLPRLEYAHRGRRLWIRLQSNAIEESRDRVFSSISRNKTRQWENAATHLRPRAASASRTRQSSRSKRSRRTCSKGERQERRGKSGEEWRSTTHGARRHLLQSSVVSLLGLASSLAALGSIASRSALVRPAAAAPRTASLSDPT